MSKRTKLEEVLEDEKSIYCSLTLLLCLSLFMSAVSASPVIPQNSPEAQPVPYERVVKS